MPLPLIGNQIVNLDADQSIFFARQLEYLKAKSYDIKYPALQATTLFPVSTEAGEGAETITYDQYDTVGIAKFISDYADDAPRSDAKGKQFSITIQSIGGSYGYTVQEIRASAFAGKNLTMLRSNAARRSNDTLVNKTAWFGDGSPTWAGLVGVLFHPNVTKSAAPVGAWTTGPKTPDQIISDINFTINKVTDLTNGVEAVDTIVLPNLEYAHIAVTPRSSYSDTTILEFLKRVYPQITFLQANELKTVTPNPRTGAESANVMLAYSRNPNNMTLEIPIIYEQFPAQERNLSYVVPVHSRLAGMNLYTPLSVHVVDGI